MYYVIIKTVKKRYKKMKMIEVDEHRGAYENTTCWYKVTGCEGKTDEEIKKISQIKLLYFA